VGREPDAEDEILIEIAWAYQCERLNDEKVNLSRIVRDVLQRGEGMPADRLLDGENPNVRRLKAKFLEMNKTLLTRAMGQTDKERVLGRY
jgi:hypothetical protein